MKLNDRIFWAVIIAALVIMKAVEMINGFDMVINPVAETAKVIGLIVMGLIGINNILIYPLLKAKKAH